VTFKETTQEGVKVLTDMLINPPSPHIIQNRVIEVRIGDGGKPSDSFLDKNSVPTNDRPNRYEIILNLH
jgi:hypothetical protein